MPDKQGILKNRTTWLHFTLIAATVLIAYFKVFKAGFLSWDDGEYILQNNDIRAVNSFNIKAWFSEFYVGNYHPLTMLSYAVDFAMGGVKPISYHAGSILLHIANAILVYLLVKKIQALDLVALTVALLFALHPSQTESVSWVAERKTVLCGLFYLLALLQYVRYAGQPSAKRMLWVIAAGAAAMLSKGTAVALPFSLLAIDIWLNRPLKDRKIWTEKIPLFLLALATGIMALKAQESGKFLDTHSSYTALQSIIYAGYAYVQYIVRFFIPAGLSAMYPYPPSIGILQYLYAALAIAIAALAVISYRKKWYVLSGGIVFYTANIALVLQFIPFGEALMADRYMYIACLGILYPTIYYMAGWLQQRTKPKVTTAVMVSVAAVLLVLTFIRNDAWLSNFNFFNAMLKTFPNSAVTQYSVGALYMQAGDYTEAEIHLDKAVRIDPNNYKAWHNKGALHMRQGRAMEALEALDKSIAINGYPKAYFTRALLHYSTGRLGMAQSDIEHVLTVQPKNGRAWLIKGNCEEQKGTLQEALSSYNKAISYSDKETLFYIRRGLLFSKMKQNQLAIEDLETAVAVDPENGDAYYYLGMVKHQAGQSPCADLQNALRRGQRKALEALEQFCKK